MAAKNYAEHPLQRARPDQHRQREDLKVAWTFSTGVNRGQEAAPIVVGDTMYVVTPFPNILYALDLKKTGRAEVEVRAEAGAAAQGVACCDVVNRGCVYDDGRIFFNTLDGHTVAVDAQDRQGSLEDEARRHQQRRDDDDGAPGREGQGPRRQQRRRVRRARAGSRRSTPRRARSPGRPTAPAPTPTA